MEPGTFLRCQSAHAIRAREGPRPLPAVWPVRHPKTVRSRPRFGRRFFFLCFYFVFRLPQAARRPGCERQRRRSSTLQCISSHTASWRPPNLAIWRRPPLLLVPTSAVPRRHACQPETQPPPNPGTRQDMARDTGNMTQPPAQYKRTSNQPNHSSAFIPSLSLCCRCSDIVRNKCSCHLRPAQEPLPQKWPSPKKKKAKKSPIPANECDRSPSSSAFLLPACRMSSQANGRQLSKHSPP